MLEPFQSRTQFKINSHLCLLSCVTLLVTACFSFDARSETPVVDAYIVPTVNGNAPVVYCKLPDRKVGSDLPIKVRLANVSEKELAFDNIRTGCNCTRITPVAGVIKPKDSLVVEIALISATRPTKNTEAFRLYFEHQSVLQFSLAGTYGFKEFLGFKEAFVSAKPGSSKESKLSLSTGLIISDDIDKTRLRFSLDGTDIQCNFHFIPDDNRVVVTLGRDSYEGLANARLCVSADLVNGKQVSESIPVIVTDSDEPKVVPHHARFTSKDEGRWKCTLFIKAPASPGSSETPVFVETRDKRFLITQSTLGSHLTRIVVSTNDGGGEGYSKEENRPKTVPLRIVVGGQSTEINVPSVWIGG